MTVKELAERFRTETLRQEKIKKGGKQMKYEVCENCGAHLDHGEKCDCGGK